MESQNQPIAEKAANVAEPQATQQKAPIQE